jgi:pimeloyl-ACP methyl ester carboxylesterase
MMDNPTIVYIHGAFSSALGFTRLIEKLPEHYRLTPEYSVSRSASKVIQDIDALIRNAGNPVTIVGHSLGGILGVSVAQRNPLIEQVITISTPFGGCKAADLIKWLKPHTFFETISTSSHIIREMHNRVLRCPVTSMVTVRGDNPMFNEPNDSVVTVASQQALKGASYHLVKYNHNEVLMSDDVVDMVSKLTFKKEEE